MDQIYIIALIISVAFVFFKMIEIKYIKKCDFVVKEIIVDALLVYLSSLAGLYGIGYIYPLKIPDAPVQVFTDEPKF